MPDPVDGGVLPTDASDERTLQRFGLPLLAAAGGVAGSFLAVGYARSFVAVPLARYLLGVLPDIVFALGIQYLGDYAQPLLVLGAAAVFFCVFAVLTLGAHRLARRTPAPVATTILGTCCLQAGLVAVVTGNAWSALGTGLGSGLAIAAGLLVPVRSLFGDRTDTSPSVRRQMLRSVGVVVGLLSLGGLRSATRRNVDSHELRDPREGVDDPVVLELLDRAEERSLALPDVDPLVSRGFYQVDITLADEPSIDPEDWSLRIDGNVPEPQTITFDGLTSRPTEHRFVTLRCVGDKLNGTKIDTALWTGTPLGPILEEANVGDECCVKVEAADGYYHAFPRAALERGFLAWGMNGKPLPEEHGAPVRVLIPGHWGEINIKWFTRIEVRDEEATGYWEKRGWHGAGPVETVAKIHALERDGQRVIVGGHAYAGTRGISRVEVSIDGGESWQDAELSEPLPGSESAEGRARDAWRMWRFEYEKPESHEVVARAYERDGTLQTREESEAFPRGATGWVRRPVWEHDS